MRDFLNDFTAEVGADKAELDKLKKLFAESVRVCAEAKGKDAFRPSRALNAAVFEAVMVGIANRLTKDKSARPI
jgi:hypothetical protein